MAGILDKLNERLKKCRRYAGLTQDELADAVKVHANTIRKWESGDHVPNAGKLAEIANVTGVNLAWLLGTSELIIDRDAMAGRIMKNADDTGVSDVDYYETEPDKAEYNIGAADPGSVVRPGVGVAAGLGIMGSAAGGIAEVAFPMLFTPALVAGAGKLGFIAAITKAAEAFADSVLGKKKKIKRINKNVENKEINENKNESKESNESKKIKVKKLGESKKNIEGKKINKAKKISKDNKVSNDKKVNKN